MTDPAWYEREEFWRDLYPYMFDDKRLTAGAEQVAQLLELTGLNAANKRDTRNVLDMCCGPGRHSVALAARGWSVTGVDRTPFLLNKARERADAARVQVEFVEQDMRDFRRLDSFDLALSLFTSFGYFVTEEEELQVLRNLHDSLRPGGLAVIDVKGKEGLARHFRPSNCDSYDDGTMLVQRHRILAEFTRMEQDWILVGADDRVRRHTFGHFLYSGRELRDLLQIAGFSAVQLYGGFDGSEYGREAHRLVAVAHKASGK